MFQGAFHTKDGFHTACIVGFFCCFFLIAGLYTEKSAAKDTQVELSTVENNVQVLSATKQMYNNKASGSDEARSFTSESVAVTKSDVPTLKKEIEVTTDTVKIPNLTKQISVHKEKVAVVDSPSIQQSESNDAEYRSEITKIITEETNAFRQKHDLLPLRYDSRLEKNATGYSKMQQEGKFLSHTSSDGCGLTCRFTKDGYEATAWGENLATMSFTKKPSAEEVASFFMSEWKKSAGHRDNLLSASFTHQGIGVSVSSTSVYATVHFAKP